VRELAPEHVVGLDDELKLVDVKLGAHTRGRHFSEKLVPWLEQLGVDTSDRSYWVARTPTARLAVDQWWPTGGRVVGFCPYGASRKKCLNDDWIKRIVTLCLDHACQVVMLVLPAQRTHIAHLIADHGWGTDVIVNPGDSTQYALFEQVARSDAVVSVDTAVVHLAVGFQKPLLSIYNSVGEEFDNWHPNHTNARVVRTVRDGDGTVNALDESELLSAIGCVITRHPPGNPI
jgi:ADP-heptose:LPS heptosyltransferase